MSERRHFLKQAVRAGAGAALAAAGVGRGIARAQASPNLVRFDHVAAPIRDVAEMVSFYRALGFEVRESESLCSVHFGDSRINFHMPVLWEDDGFTLRAMAARPPCADFCFVWGGSEAELLRTLERVGAEIIEGPIARFGGQNGGRDEGTSRYIRDPDGNLLEFIVYS